MHLITLTASNSSHPYIVVASRIVYLNKPDHPDITFVHLDTGEVLRSDDTMEKIVELMRSPFVVKNPPTP